MTGWEKLNADCIGCKKCDLCKTRTNVVIGRGNVNAPIMLIGEGPGEQEDLQGIPFVGAAGKLLDLLLEALNFNEDDYYIANIVKCRPPGNRAPTDEEGIKCLPYLRTQVKLIRPKIIVCLGATAARYIIDKNSRITQIRGQWKVSKGFSMIATFHPAALLRDESKKVLVWEDFKKVRNRLDSLRDNKI